MHGYILVVDDDAGACWALENALRTNGYSVNVANGAAAALRHCRNKVPALIITDVRMPGGSGLDLLADVKKNFSHVPVIVMTAYGSIDTASAAIARGAFDYLIKPLDLQRTLAVVERAVGTRAIAIEVVPGTAVDTALVGDAPAMQEVCRRIALAATSSMPVLMSGPTGSGKEVAARLIHRFSSRKDAAFVAVNCGTLDSSGAGVELFGRAATEGTVTQGLFSAAHGGTLLLDEVGDLPAAVQGSLLRILDDQQVRPVGSSSSHAVDVRIIAITNRDIANEAGFRTDLFHRLSGMSVVMPALADHRSDIPLLTSHLLSRVATRLGRSLALTEAALTAIHEAAWPGNVRELRQTIEAAVAVAPSGIIDVEHLHMSGNKALAAAAGTAGMSDLRAEAERILDEAPGKAHARWLDHLDGPLIVAALARTRGNQLRAAELLGMHRATLRKRAQELGLTVQRGADDGADSEG